MNRRGSRSRVATWVVGVIVLLAIVAFFTVVPAVVDARMNAVVEREPPPVADSIRAFHDSLFVVDLHADELLWNRDLVTRAGRGHVDLPRLVDGNVAIQVFSAVTKAPRGLNFDRNTGETDNITLLAIAQRWPVATWTSRTARALHQASKLASAESRADGGLTILRSGEDIARLIQRRDARQRIVGGVLAIEGLHALDGTLERVDTLFAAGYRMMGLTHFFDNEVGASAHGVSHAGLTPFGQRVIARMEALGVIVDLAHASPNTIRDALAVTTRPVVVSHTGVAATCPGPRNLTDDQLRAIAAKGGLIGIGYFEGAVCGLSAAAIARAVVHAVQVAGIEHVALGSDFDGAVETPWDTRGLPALTAALLEAGLTRGDVRRVMGGNASAFLLAMLPAK